MPFGEDAGIGKVGALQKVAVDRIAVEWLAGSDNLPDVCPVIRRR
jgi:hypothetical protein